MLGLIGNNTAFGMVDGALATTMLQSDDKVGVRCGNAESIDARRSIIPIELMRMTFFESARVRLSSLAFS